MATVLYSASMSLDGFIAGPRGDMSWLTRYSGPDPAAEAIVDQIGALLVGNRTFHGDDPNRGTDKEGAFDGQWSGPTFVLTHNPPAEPVPGITFVGDLASGLAAASEAAGEKYVNIIGADVARQCVEASLLDEVLVFVAPALLGDGVRLFDAPGGNHVGLERLSVTEAPKSTSIRFRVVR